MVGQKPRLTDFIVAPLKVAVLAALPLLAGVEIGNRAAAGSDIAGAGQSMPELAQNPERAFDDALVEGYRGLAGALEKSSRNASPNDWADAQYFAHKAMAADRGENEGPEDTNNWKLSGAAHHEIEEVRPRVAAAIDLIAGEPSNYAAAEAAASAQVSFDCWVERSEEPDGDKGAAECRTALEEALMAFDTAISGEGIAAATASDPQ